MEASYQTTMNNAEHVAVRGQSRTTMGWLAYRFGLVIFGLLWVFLSSTLCGCGTMNGYVMNRSGKRYFDKGNYEFARYEFERALMDDPHNANYAFNVARTMEREGEYENAELMYQHALTINPNHQPSYHALASMLREQGRAEEARALLVAWADTQPYSTEAQMSASNFYQQEGNLAAAQTHYQQALRNNPPTRRQQRLAAKYYNPQQPFAAPPQQTMAYGSPNQLASPRYPYHATPSLQMATTMPQNDFTMMGGPVVAHQTMGPIYMSPQPADPTWTPSPDATVPQQYLPPQIPSSSPQLLPELPAPTSQNTPQAYSTQPVISQQWTPSPYPSGVYPETQQPMMTTQPYTVPQPMTGTPFQNISSQTRTNIVPAVQAF